MILEPKERKSVTASTFSLSAAKSLQSCPTLCDPIDGSPPGSALPGILQARTLEWVAISFFNAWKWKGKWSHLVMSDSSQPHELQPTRLLYPWDFPGKSTGVGCHCLLPTSAYLNLKNATATQVSWAGRECGREEVRVKRYGSIKLKWQFKYFTLANFTSNHGSTLLNPSCLSMGHTLWK